MAGGVREWCDDWVDAAQSYKIVRGGSTGGVDPAAFRSAGIWWVPPRNMSDVTGFRIVREPLPPR